MLIGRVKWFNREKGYGYLESPLHPHVLMECPSFENGPELLDLRESEQVVFDVKDSLRGPYAVGVRRWDHAA